MFFQNIKIRCFAKINLGLAVINKRKDGYHNIETVVQSISLSDIIKIKETEKETKIFCSNPEVPQNRENLVFKGINLLKERYSLNKNFEIEIEKNIPAGSGLGGGSSNVANVLLGLNKIYKLNLKYKELLNLSKEIGSDVGFFLKGGTAFLEGRGEKIKKLPDLYFWAVIVKPEFSISTSWAYRNLKKYSEKGKIKNVLNIVKNKDIKKFSYFLKNDFEEIVKEKYPEIENIKREFIKYGAIFSSLSGTGSAVFGIFENRDSAEKTEEIFKKRYKDVFLVKTEEKGGEILW
jgi:4-diphosphocytidyl-2-C-methyl-D-erythritol kinase